MGKGNVRSRRISLPLNDREFEELRRTADRLNITMCAVLRAGIPAISGCDIPKLISNGKYIRNQLLNIVSMLEVDGHGGDKEENREL